MIYNLLPKVHFLKLKFILLMSSKVNGNQNAYFYFLMEYIVFSKFQFSHFIEAKKIKFTETMNLQKG